ncbi:HECT E3 ubiquitin ligase [Phytophthora megakarya]|uniref:HECT E3 ubiquitin ligase n=1 Tax=Phytophthora megakarya TaxID=4795 RepID=A0A225WKM9_9STRA|nr:HECT E3 ubiquitin ligase [Phytophthora megakarya]
MEPSSSRGGRKRRGGGKRKRSTSRQSEDEERKTETPEPKQEDQEEKQQEDKPKQWSCPACTFLNDAARCFCEMCETPNPSPPPSAARALGSSSEWNCAACTMTNPTAMRVCAMCGTLNPRPAGLNIGRLSESLSSSDSDDEDSDSEEETWIYHDDEYGDDDDDMDDDELDGEEGYYMDYDDDEDDDEEGCDARERVLHDMDIQNVERSVISTVACVLEMAPSQLIHSLKEADVELILVDLVDIFEQPNSITTYEFKQSGLLPAVLQYLSPQGELDEARAIALVGAFERYPSALKHLVFRLQNIITQEETFPLVSFNNGKGRELYPLTRQLKISFMRSRDRNVGDTQPETPSGRFPAKGKSIHSSPLTHFQSFERTVSRCMPVVDSDLSLLYLNLVGHSIQKVVEGKWRKFLVVGYDDKRSHHLLKPLGGTEDDLAEMVVHDSQCKLIGNVKVYESIELDLALFGSPDASTDSSSHSDSKKKRKSNKRKRKSTQKLEQHKSEGTFEVEVNNEDMLRMATLPGAWHAAELVNNAGETLKLSDGKYQSCEEAIAAQSNHSVRLLTEKRIVHKVPVDNIRTRTRQPQVGSVVEVDGSLGEVTSIYSNDRSSSNSMANVLFDVKTSSDIEKCRVKKQRVRFPPQQTTATKFGGEGDRIEAMSIRRLFPARDSSLLAGSVGDRVWVRPPVGSLVQNLCVAGTIKSFPSGLESIRESATVLVEVSFGSAQAPLTVKVNQDRVLNFAVDGSGLSGRGPSRLLAALQMASGRGGSSRAFGGGRNSHDSDTTAIHRAFERVAGSLHQSRLGGNLGSSGTAIDQLRNLISRNSVFSGANVPSDTDVSDQPQSSRQGPVSNSLPNELIGSEVQTEEETSSTSSSKVAITQQKSSAPENSTEEISSPLQTYLKPQGEKPKTICSQLPKVSLVVGFRRCDPSVTSQERIIVSSEFGLERVDKGKIGKDTPTPSLIIQMNPSTQRFEAKIGAQKALLGIFNSYSGVLAPGGSQKKKRRKLSPVGQRKTGQGAPWDIEKFISFMQTVRGPEKYGDTGSSAKYCISFSKFADPETNRKLLKPDGFISLVVHECKDSTKSNQLLKFLKSRGYSEKSITSGGSRSSSGDDEEEKDSPSGESKTFHAKSTDNNILRQPVVLRGFPPDQNVLKCVEDLRQDYQARTRSNSDMTTFDPALPPWKLTYKVYCDFQIEWEVQSSSNTNTSNSANFGPESLVTLAVLDSKPPTRLLSHGIAALDGMDVSGAAETSRWLTRITTPHACSGTQHKLVVPDSVASAVRLLHYLFQFRADVASLDESLWTSPRLYNKLETQMQDVLSMCSGIYPPWCDALVTHCKFFFPHELRKKLFRSTSFGCTRSLHWFRNQLNIEESSSDSMSSMVGGGIYNQEISISPIPKERVKVHRGNILQSAEAVMKMHAKRKAILDVVFVGEKGYGSGVTAAFYSTTAHALQVISENEKNRYWIPGEDDEAAAKTNGDEVELGDDIADDAPVIRHSNGLFPYPHRSPTPKLIERFRMMGRLAGKALMDERLLPLPLSTQFLKLVVGESFGLHEVGNIFLSHGRILYSMYKASKKLKAGEQNVQIDQMDVQDWLDAVGFTFIDPFSQEPLVDGGENIAVTANNLMLYVRAVLELWLDSGIHAQVLAFRDGISEVLPLGKLRLLFVPELLSLLCGEVDIEWNVDSLMKDTKLAHGYTKDSQPVQFFFEVLDEMSATERRSFLLYATGCPNLPPGGFQALKPPFEVVRRVVDTVDVDRALPFARTCTNTLHLPAYSSKDVLSQQMTFAIANSRGVIDRD